MCQCISSGLILRIPHLFSESFSLSLSLCVERTVTRRLTGRWEASLWANKRQLYLGEWAREGNGEGKRVNRERGEERGGGGEREVEWEQKGSEGGRGGRQKRRNGRVE